MEVDGTLLLTLLGIAAGVLILTGWVEQIYKGYKTKRSKRCFKISNDLHLCRINFMVNLWNHSIRCIHHRHKCCRANSLMMIVLAMKKRYENKLM